MNFSTRTHVATLPPSQLLNPGLFHGNGAEGGVFVYGGGIPANATASREPISCINSSLWEFSPKEGSWSIHDLNLEHQYAPRHGVFTQAHEHNLAFYFNGLIRNGTKEEPHARMTVLDLDAKTARSLSTDSIVPKSARVGAMLQYVPHIGAKGALVLMGGGVMLPNDDAETHGLGSTMVFD